MSDLKLKRALTLTSLILVACCFLATLAFALAQENEVGAAVYKKRCLMCHGEDGVGDTKAGKMTKTPDITVEEWKKGKTVEELIVTLREGLGKMPKYEGKLSDDELNAVSEYTIQKFVK
jgi:mono/diheme cytochrome c family protein